MVTIVPKELRCPLCNSEISLVCLNRYKKGAEYSLRCRRGCKFIQKMPFVHNECEPFQNIEIIFDTKDPSLYALADIRYIAMYWDDLVIMNNEGHKKTIPFSTITSIIVAKKRIYMGRKIKPRNKSGRNGTKMEIKTRRSPVSYIKPITPLNGKFVEFARNRSNNQQQKEHCVNCGNILAEIGYKNHFYINTENCCETNLSFPSCSNCCKDGDRYKFKYCVNCGKEKTYSWKNYQINCETIVCEIPALIFNSITTEMFAEIEQIIRFRFHHQISIVFHQGETLDIHYIYETHLNDGIDRYLKSVNIILDNFKLEKMKESNYHIPKPCDTCLFVEAYCPNESNHKIRLVRCNNKKSSQYQKDIDLEGTCNEHTLDPIWITSEHTKEKEQLLEENRSEKS